MTWWCTISNQHDPWIRIVLVLWHLRKLFLPFPSSSFSISFNFSPLISSSELSSMSIIKTHYLCSLGSPKWSIFVPGWGGWTWYNWFHCRRHPPSPACWWSWMLPSDGLQSRRWSDSCPSLICPMDCQLVPIWTMDYHPGWTLCSPNRSQQPTSRLLDRIGY